MPGYPSEPGSSNITAPACNPRLCICLMTLRCKALACLVYARSLAASPTKPNGVSPVQSVLNILRCSHAVLQAQPIGWHWEECAKAVHHCIQLMLQKLPTGSIMPPASLWGSALVASCAEITSSAAKMALETRTTAEISCKHLGGDGNDDEDDDGQPLRVQVFQTRHDGTYKCQLKVTRNDDDANSTAIQTSANTDADTSVRWWRWRWRWPQWW